jgi:sterol desaturase/sphingolipid hydroxylase (fatty acid hydroxylase superfamily)
VNETVIAYALYPLSLISQPYSLFFLPTYAVAAVFGVLLLMIVKRRIFNRASIVALLWPARLMEHPSTKLDIKLFFISAYYLLLQGLLVGAVTLVSVDGAIAGLDWLAGFRPEALEPSWLITGVTMFLVFLAVEFGYWLSHYLMHRIPALWEFHKVHHSAEVLTPATEWRQHPLELLIWPCLIGTSACLVQGPMIWAFGASAQVIDPMNANLISLVFWYTTVHLRHTELPIFAPNWLAHLVQTPPHHQIHHSVNPKHFDKNMGYCLSIFDWLFGTLYIPKRDEKLTFGLGHQDTALETAVGSVVAPFGRAFSILMKPWRKPVATTGKSLPAAE